MSDTVCVCVSDTVCVQAIVYQGGGLSLSSNPSVMTITAVPVCVSGASSTCPDSLLIRGTSRAQRWSSSGNDRREEVERGGERRRGERWSGEERGGQRRRGDTVLTELCVVLLLGY